MIYVAADADRAAVVAAGVVGSILQERAERADGPLLLALSGGKSPRRLYELLAGDEGAGIPWPRIHLVWGDERCVPPDDPRSNYLLALESGLLGLPLGGVHRMRGERLPEEGAQEYEWKLRRLAATGASLAGMKGRLSAPGPGLLELDLAVLGLGQDGHTASLLPGSIVLAVEDRWVAATESYRGTRRLTLTLPLLAAARHLLFLVTGADKAAAVGALLATKADEVALPARILLDRVTRTQRVASARRCPCVSWVLDREAASGLPEGVLCLDVDAGRG
jgi:6-phosphogluconolactonase